MAVDDEQKGLKPAGIERLIAGGSALPFSPADIAREMALAARELAEQIEFAETGLICRLDPADAPGTLQGFEGLRRRARIFGCIAEYFQRIKIGVDPMAA